MHIDPKAFPLTSDNDPVSSIRRIRQFIGKRHGTWDGSQSSAHLGLGTGGMPDDVKVVIGAVDPGIDLGLKQVDRSADGQEHNARHTKQAGIEMPSPDRPIIRPGR